MADFIPLSVPNIKGNELKYVTEALETEWVSSGGPHVTKLEDAVAHYVKADRAVACQSGTAGLHMALRVCGVQEGDLVLVPTLTFIAAVNPVKYLGADPIFMDCDKSLCMDLDKLERFLREACEVKNGTLYHAATGRRIPALVIVHVFGNLPDMERLLALAEQFNLKIVEDATEALGTYVTRGSLAGKHAGTFGDVGVYSFNGNKIMTTGGGGMVVSRHPEMLDKIKYLSTQAKDDPVNFVHNEIGYNYRMTNLQAAVGLAQLELLEVFIETKHKNYEVYADALADIPGIELLPFRSGIRSNQWFYSLIVDEMTYGVTRAHLMEALSGERIQTRPVWQLIHHQKPYVDSVAYQIEQAEYYEDHILNIPCSTNLTKAEIDRVVRCIWANRA